MGRRSSPRHGRQPGRSQVTGDATRTPRPVQPGHGGRDEDPPPAATTFSRAAPRPPGVLGTRSLGDSPCSLLRSAGSRAATASETRDGRLTPALLTALTRNAYERPSQSPVTGYLQTFTGASLHCTQLSVPTSHLRARKGAERGGQRGPMSRAVRACSAHAEEAVTRETSSRRPMPSGHPPTYAADRTEWSCSWVPAGGRVLTPGPDPHVEASAPPSAASGPRESLPFQLTPQNLGVPLSSLSAGS